MDLLIVGIYLSVCGARGEGGRRDREERRGEGREEREGGLGGRRCLV